MRWEQNVVLGDRRWQWENMKSTQRFAKELSRELLGSHSRHSDIADVDIRNQLHLLSTELGEFVKPDKRGLTIQDNQAIVAHGRTAYELTKGLISCLEREI